MLFDALPRRNTQITLGVVHLPNWLSLADQARLIEQLREIARQVVGTQLFYHDSLTRADCFAIDWRRSTASALAAPKIGTGPGKM